MTKTNLQYIIMLAMCFMCIACDDDDDSIDYTKYYSWRDQNNFLTFNLLDDAKYLGTNAYFTDSIVSLSEPFAVSTLYRRLENANEDSLRKIGKWYTPYYTSTVKVHYTLYNPKSVWNRFEEYGVLYSQSKRNDAAIMDRIFGIGYTPGMPGHEVKADTLESFQVQTLTTTCDAVIKGWQDCLQNMHIGDNWLITVPWYLAYGQVGSGSNIDPYTNLYFRIKLVDITSLGDNK